MTGYGSETMTIKGLTIKCEISSLNKKNLEINLNLPKYCIFMELPLRKAIQETLVRGNINLFFQLQWAKGSKQITLNHTFFKTWQSQIKELCEKYHLRDDISASSWLNTSGIWDIKETEADNSLIEPLMMKCLQKSMEKLILMRNKEGRELEKDLMKRLQIIEGHLEKIQKRSPELVKKFEEKISRQVNGSNNFSKTEQDLFGRFISVFSEKTDIAEEITRLKSHISQFKSYLKSNEAVGRSMDFLLQEFMREANTIGSKANDTAIAQNVVAIKTTIEQIREQVQNLL